VEKVKLGLALSGGGACGAYEVGAIKVLAKMGFEPRAVAGSSIGALNGAVVSAFRIKKAAARLEKIWLDLYTEKVLQPRQRPLPVKTVRPAGIRRGHLRLRRPAKISPPETTGDFFTRLRQLLTDKAFAIYDETPLDNIINSAINLKRLYRGKEFYASAFPGSQGLTGAVADLFYWLLARGKSEFFHIQSLSPDKILTVLKASAAVPLAFPAQQINGRYYRDGSLGSRNRGNIPIEPLIACGCTHIIAVILENSSRLDPKDWPGVKVVEIRPSKQILQMGNIKALFDFSPERIAQLITLGEKDTRGHKELPQLKKEISSLRNPWRRLTATIRRKGK
jgi:NTE family protein